MLEDQTGAEEWNRPGNYAGLCALLLGNILKPHCEEEEWLLDQLVTQYDVNRARLKEEHKLVQSLIELIGKEKILNKELFRVLDQDLVDLIRWEERELFPYLQAVVDDEKLDHIGKQLAQKHKQREDTFVLEFWTKKA